MDFLTRFVVLLLWIPTLGIAQSNLSTNILYDRVVVTGQEYPELIGTGLDYGEGGLSLRQQGELVRLNHYYSLAQRLVRYHVRFTADAKAVFQSNEGDFKAFVDMAHRTMTLETSPSKQVEVPFLTSDHDYIVEIYRDYQTSGIRLIDLHTGDDREISATTDGPGGAGKGAEQAGFQVGLQHDYYCFGLHTGTELLVRQIIVSGNASNLQLLMYGDSITEPEGYYPSKDFPQSRTQLILQKLDGRGICSGRGGTTINEILKRIKNELPYLKAKYVMVTIGTNGGNTEENLSTLVEYIRSQGSIPILNNIPANERNSHIACNQLIEKVRQKYGLKGCKFDVATSVRFDGQEVDKTTMYFEDYDWGKIYHHPNVKGSKLMYLRTLIDVPGIYE